VKQTGRLGAARFAFRTSGDGRGLSGFTDHIDLRGAVFALADQLMPGFDAEMWDIDDGCRIIGQNAQGLARIHAFQAFARFENGQGAQKAGGVQCVIYLAHTGGISDRANLGQCPCRNVAWVVSV